MYIYVYIMEIPMFISSSDGINKSTSHDFTVTFNPQIDLEKNVYSYAALNSLSMS